MRLKPFVSSPMIVALFSCMPIASWAAPAASLAKQESAVPNWLMQHVGTGEGQIAWQVLLRARALYLRKVSESRVKNPCYFAMDATRPNSESNGESGRRFYVMCESAGVFRAISAGHGSGRRLGDATDFANGRVCAKNFGNAMDSELTAGGAYLTAEIKPSFKGYYRASNKTDAALVRSFIQFDGEGETANARQRAIGGHAAVVLKGVCLWKNPHSSYANHDGYVPRGTLVDYSSGRSNGCTSWSPNEASKILEMVKDQPTTLYIYPEAADIDAVARSIAAGRSLTAERPYWNATCLKEIGVPKFWRKEYLEPIIARYKSEHPTPPPRPLPICRGG